jgi:hypothetical protein
MWGAEAAMARTRKGPVEPDPYLALYRSAGDLDVIASMLERQKSTFRFAPAVRAKLSNRFPESVVAGLEVAVDHYQIREEALGKYRVERVAIGRSRKRLAKSLEVARREWNLAHPAVKADVHPIGAQLSFYIYRLRGRQGRPREESRRELHLDVGRALVNGDIKLRKSSVGALAFALQVVVPAVDPTVQLADPMPVCVDVCDTILAERRASVRQPDGR